MLVSRVQGKELRIAPSCPGNAITAYSTLCQAVSLTAIMEYALSLLFTGVNKMQSFHSENGTDLRNFVLHPHT